MVWNNIVQEAENFRRQLHQHPELTWEEHGTAQRIRECLDTLNIPWESCAGTGTIARLAQNASGQHVGLRGDIDALPIHEQSGAAWSSTVSGSMHACGHDGHTAVLYGTAAWLKANEAVLPGPVSLIFQPAEEGGHGAKKMIEEGALNGIDCIYGWHNWPAIPFGQAVCPEGPVMSANGTFSIDVSGVGGHGSQPESCCDPVLAGSAIVLALQQVVSRRLAPQTSAVLSVTSFDALSASNVIPSKATLAGGIRASDSQSREKIAKLANQICEDTARSYGCSATFNYQACYGATVNHAQASVAFEGALAQTLGNDWRCQEIPVPIMASEDFSYFLEEKPGAFALIGANDSEAHAHSCHSAHYDFNDRLIPVVVSVYARLVGAPVPT